MIFASYSYLAFLLVAFTVHWLLPSRARNAFLIFASYCFYCSWRWQFGFLLLAVSLFNWGYARTVLAKSDRPGALSLGVIANVLVLVYFKYPAFIIDNVVACANVAGANWHPDVGRLVTRIGAQWDPVKHCVLPALGISFFTFQGVAYLVDVATGEAPLESLQDFLLFKALWPQLIAGPIIRLHEIRDQIRGPRTLAYEDVAAGAQRILYGLFKKIVLADNLAPTVELVFGSRFSPSFVDCVAVVIGFGLQIYLDFSSYSDMAIGSARLIGFHFPENFNWPYVSRSPHEFWQRWHMSLSRWIRDYVFTPLAFASRKRPALAPLWLLLSMALCGLWHGAAWLFVIWGVWHGVLLAANQTFAKKFFAPTGPGGTTLPMWRSLLTLGVTFALVHVGWIFFRAASLGQALDILRGLGTMRGGLRPSMLRENAVLIVALIFVMMLIAQLSHRFFAAKLESSPRFALGLRLCKPFFYVAMIVIVIAMDEGARTFVYFQF